MGRLQLNCVLKTSGLPVGPFRDEIRLTPSWDDFPITPLVIPVNGEIESNIQSKPKFIYLGVIQKGILKTGNFTVESTRPITFNGINPAANPLLKVKLIGQTKTELLFQYQVADALSAGNRSGYFDVKINDGEAQVLRIPYILYVKDTTK